MGIQAKELKMTTNSREAVLATIMLIGLVPPACVTENNAEATEATEATEPTEQYSRDDGTNVAIQWNQIFIDTLIATTPANASSPRLGAIVHTAMADAYAGVTRDYEPILYRTRAPRHTSSRAAVVAASYTGLVSLFPTRQAELDAAYDASLAEIEDGDSKQRGIDYGIAVAQAVLAWRAADGFTTPLLAFTGGTAVGQWRPTPPANGPMSAQGLAFTQDFVSGSNQFRPVPPRGLLTTTWTDDFNAVKALGRKTGSTRTDDQTFLAPFWEGNASIHWNQAANQAAVANELSTKKSVRLFAILNVAMADTVFTTTSAKRFYGADPDAVTWRPVTAIPLGDTDGNPDTIADATWEPLMDTPSHPEYAAGHPSLNGAGSTALLSFFDDAQTFTLTTGATSRTYSSIAQARSDGNNARIWGGMHYPSTVAISDAEGEAVASYVNEVALRRRCD